jgi:hypothetical protein
MVIIVFVAIGAIGYLAYQNAQLKKQDGDSTKTTESSDISNWETYINEEYRFEFKYPRYWKVENINTKGSKFLLRLYISSPDLVVEDYYAGDWPTHEYKKGATLSFSIEPSKYYTSFKQLSEGEKKEWLKQKTIIIDGIDALYTINETHGASHSIEALMIKSQLNDPKFLIYDITLIFPQKEISKHSNTFDQILSTFNFIE